MIIGPSSIPDRVSQNTESCRWVLRCAPNDPKIDELKAEIKAANKLLGSFAVGWRIKVSILGRLGTKNPNRKLYPHGTSQNVRMEHSAYVDVYAKPTGARAWGLSNRALERCAAYSEDWPGFKLDLPVRPISLNSNGQAHSTVDPWIEWADGEKWYAHNGVEIPGWWITEPERLTGDYALILENAEHRRAAIDILGWDRVLISLTMSSINKDEDAEVGELVEVELPNIGRERFLRVLCATGRWFVIPVPPETKTALEGQAWLWELDEMTYSKPEVTT